jgi:hypothetical protein
LDKINHFFCNFHVYKCLKQTINHWAKVRPNLVTQAWINLVPRYVHVVLFTSRSQKWYFLYAQKKIQTFRWFSLIRTLCQFLVISRVARFFLVQYTKGAKRCTKITWYKITKCPLNIPDGRKILPMEIIYNIIFHSEVLPNIPELVFLFWIENIWQPWWFRFGCKIESLNKLIHYINAVILCLCSTYCVSTLCALKS